jgi:hypothetical protein
MSIGAQYVYPPIDSIRGEIRILNVNPGKQGCDLGLSFEVLCIHDNPLEDFDAVSYRWRSQIKTQPVTIDEQLFVLTSNQSQIIQDLRYTDSNRRIWIDAICIDQTNVVERSQQVQLMRLIYSKAHRVCVWIDDEISRDSCVYDHFLRLEHESDVIESLEGQHNFWDPICNVLMDEYFTRVWVQQEMSNAIRLSLQCRNTILTSACLLLFVQVWDDISIRYYNDDTPFTTGCSFHKNLPPKLFNRLVGRTTYGNQPMDLMEVLCKSRELSCTDPRDIVYGLMHISHEWRQCDLIVDYTLAVSEVYRQAMIACCAVYGTLCFLEHANFSYINHERILDKTPSWVPDFRKKSQRQPRENRRLRQGTGYPLRQDYSHLARFSGNLLHTYGVKVANIQRCFDFWSTTGSPMEVSVHEFIDLFNQIIRLASFPETSEDRTRRLVWLLTEAPKPSPLALENESFLETADLFADILKQLYIDSPKEDGTATTLLELHLITSRQSHRDSSTGNHMAIGEGKYRSSALSVMLANLVAIQAEKAAPFICAAGYIGLASLEARPGDEIWLIPTCPRPIVLRPDDGKYLVLGRAWYDDDMTWRRFPGGSDVGCNETFVNARTEICLK